MSGQALDLVLDTSALIALVSSWHVRHQQVHAFVEKRLAAGDRLALPGHALFEAYSVLTRLPAPYRLSPSDAHELLRVNFSATPVLALRSRERWSLLAECADRGVSGGRAYDALIAGEARSGTESTLLTLNPRHFEVFESPRLRIASPS